MITTVSPHPSARPGAQSVEFALGPDIAQDAGIYFMRLRAGGAVGTRSLVLVR